MKTSKPAVKYQGISVPVTLIDEIKKYIEDSPRYRGIGEFTREAIRDRLNQPNLNQSTLKEYKKGLDQITKKSEELQKILESFDDESIKKLKKLSKIL